MSYHTFVVTDANLRALEDAPVPRHVWHAITRERDMSRWVVVLESAQLRSLLRVALTVEDAPTMRPFVRKLMRLHAGAR